ncbi:MAG TPA: hypothetical protein VM052_02540 [Candidatus Limnocylindrales bacterium]|nr:hypothetical protein [Candidatus Limnocylindrales bacterium]
MEHLPLDPAPEAPHPRRATLTLLVGRVTTIKLAYWAALTIFEIGLAALDRRPFVERFPLSVGAAVLLSLGAIVWARHSARVRDPRIGMLPRSIPTIATTFAATTVVASPECLPLLIVERERSLESCGFGTCHAEALLLWVGVLVVGTLLIPLAFAASLRKIDEARSLVI